MVRASLEIGNSNQELMEKGGTKKWKVWLMGAIILILVSCLVVAGVVIFSRAQQDDGDLVPSANALTMEDIARGKVSPRRFNGTWISGDEILYVDIHGNLAIYNVTQDASVILVNKENQLLASSFEQQLSADRMYVLFSISYTKLYRHSYSAIYIAFKLESSQQYLISSNVNETFLELVEWAPVGNAMAFVQNNNVFYKSAVEDAPVQLTRDGVPGVIYNGVPDWVYEEEIFSSNKALWFSPDGSHLAYGSFNDSQTPIMSISFYDSQDNANSQYTRIRPVKYPKVGTINPTAKVFLVNLTQPVSVKPLPIPPNLNGALLATVTFANNSTLSVTWTNRIQNDSLTLFCDFKDNCREVFSYSEPKGWVDMLHPSIFTEDGSFFRILPKKTEDDAFRQVARFFPNGTQTFLTSGNNTVTELLQWDQHKQVLWFMATSPLDSAFQHLYSVSLEGDLHCFSCQVSHSSGTECLYNEVVLSRDASHLVLMCLGPQIPEIYIYNKDGYKLKDLELNSHVADFLSTKAVPVVHRYTVQIAKGKLPPAQVILITPQGADLSGATKYPLLVNVYGGPDSYQVLEKWQVGWGESLVSRWNITLAMIDGRGSGLRGNNNLFSIFRNFGTYEINDQINVTRHLQRTLGFVDPERTCIWGWSYGGFASALALSRGGNVFKCAVSVAPVTNWLLYDSIYTERYMGLPTKEDNLKGYQAAKLATTQFAHSLSKKKLMLIHGTFDDNVHYQQSMVLSRVLQREDVLFTQMTYPDEDHGLINVKPHLYHTIEQFLKPNLLKSSSSYK